MKGTCRLAATVCEMPIEIDVFVGLYHYLVFTFSSHFFPSWCGLYYISDRLFRIAFTVNRNDFLSVIPMYIQFKVDSIVQRCEGDVM